MSIGRPRLWLTTAVVAAVSATGVVTAVAPQAATAWKVSCTVTNQWQGGFGANVTIDNLCPPRRR